MNTPGNGTASSAGTRDGGLTGRVLVAGFAVALAVWCAAFIAHIPWLDLSASVTGPVVLGAWVVAAIVAGRSESVTGQLKIGLCSGVATAAICLLILGSALVEQFTNNQPAPGTSGLRPSAIVFVPAFLALGAIIGAIGSLVGARLRDHQPARATASASDWLSRFSIVTAAAILALLVLGGAVTSTESGMAIRGWPGSDTANMFLYPLSLMADSQRFLEHSHRLFGTFVGLCSIVLFLGTLSRSGPGGASRRVAALTLILLAAVIAQGAVGGLRVIENDALKGLFHGIGGQLIFALAVSIAAMLSPSWAAAAPPEPHPAAGRRHKLTTALALCMIVQLSLGAAYRHLAAVSKGATHALYTHAAFAFVVITLAMIAGATMSKPDQPPILRRIGKSLIHTVGLQFLLGLVSLWAVMVSPTRGAPPPEPGGGPIRTPAIEAILTTSHQAVGAVLFALVALAWVWSRRLHARR